MTTTKAASIDDVRYEDLIDLRDLAELQSSLAARWMAHANGDGPPTMVRYSYFTDYAQELAEDIGLVDSSNTLHGYVDWERFASDLQMNFRSVDFGGIEFFIGH